MVEYEKKCVVVCRGRREVVGGTKGWWFGQVDKGEGGRRDWELALG